MNTKHVYLVSVTLEIYSPNGSSIVLDKHKNCFINQNLAQEKAQYYREAYKSNPDNVYKVAVICLELEDVL